MTWFCLESKIDHFGKDYDFWSESIEEYLFDFDDDEGDDDDDE